MNNTCADTRAGMEIIMVLYFSGTGNSQFVALQIAQMLADDEIISINKYLKERRLITIRSKRPLVFVAPTYSWQMPRAVEQWIMKTTFEGNKNAYFILTCGGSCGNAAFYAKKLCLKKELLFCGLAPVLMPENYLAMFPTPGEAECKEIVENSKPQINVLAKQIQSGKCFDTPSVSLIERLESGPVNMLFYPLFVHDKGFSVSDRCISCGKCALRCPLNNIDLINNKPVWKGRCTHCMACIGGCPAVAIEYKTKSKNCRRHYIMNDSLCYKNGGN